MIPTRLQMGTSRLENLPPRSLATFLSPLWVHLGDPPKERSLPKRIYRRIFRAVHSPEQVSEMYRQTEFRPFVYAKGDRLDFPNASMGFIYSEHFFEHLFLDEALALLKECYRVCSPGGVIRIVVPDADLRTYAKPEPPGFPSVRLPFSHPDKHKTRWSVYSLGIALEVSGFRPNPLRYCDKQGTFIQNEPTYQTDKDTEVTNSLAYVIRPFSLIVDGIKT